MKKIEFHIDGKKCVADAGQTVTEAARANSVYIPTLCDFEGLNPAGTCRVCTSRINGIMQAACMTVVEEGMTVENDVPDIQDSRKAVIEMLYVEGNHQGAACEKSGNGELQALAYRYQILVPRFPYQFPVRQIDVIHPKIMIDTDRCIQCMRCIRGIKSKSGIAVFRMTRSDKLLRLSVIPEAAGLITDEIAGIASDLCPVGAILTEGGSYRVPIGRRKYDTKEIGSDIEKT